MAELEARNRELEAFSYTVAHDLKSPLNLILGYAELLMVYTPEELQERATAELARISENAVRMGDMIDQLLLLATTTHATEAAVMVDMRPLVSIALARFEKEIAERRIKVEVQPDLPPAMGHGPWVVEIFANLISNGIKYLGKENHTPSLGISGRLEGESVCYAVHDNGVGIEAADRERLFKSLTRLRPDLAEGLGLGLSIVHRLVTKLNGQVGVESEVGVGSTFWFTLPCATDR
jgi:signal transduction histidine kinase